jgi:hypothetical protein
VVENWAVQSELKFFRLSSAYFQLFYTLIRLEAINLTIEKQLYATDYFISAQELGVLYHID